MAYARNGQDGSRIHFEDCGGSGEPVVVHDGFGDSVEDLREWGLVDALAREGYRVVLADHRGHGRSERPHDPMAYAMWLRVADAIAILDRLGIERAHFAGRSWGGRLCFGIGERVPERVRSLVIGGNQPYAWPDTPLTRSVDAALAAACEQLSCEPLARTFEELWNVALPAAMRARLLANDPLALHAAWIAAKTEGAIATDLASWRVPCLIYIGAADADFLDGARRAADEIPAAELLVLDAADHYAAHLSGDDVVIDAALRTLRRASDPREPEGELPLG